MLLRGEEVASVPRVVNDTVIWLSALYFAGETVKIIKLIEDKSIVSVTSDFILQEVKEKLMEFGTPDYAANGTITYISSISETVSLKNQDFGLRDPADNQILETAVVGNCNFLITRDKDLLSIGRYDQVQIVTPYQFLSTKI